MPHLVVVESPGKTRKINDILGPDYVVRASFGHVRDLPQSGSGGGGRGRGPVPLGIDIAGGWVPTWELLPRKAEVVSELRRLAGSGPVYLATDLDREGEAIAWHLADLIGGPADRFRRVTFAEITPTAVRAAFGTPRRIDQPLVRAQLARRFIDRVVGFEISPVFSRRLRAALSAGRVQSAALKLLADREDGIRLHRAAAFFTVELRLPVDGGHLRASLVDAEGSVRRLDDAGDAEALRAGLGGHSARVEDVERKAVNRRPAPPFTTSTLQQAASSRLKSSVSDTMAAAQRLYEAGLVTYMRTDSTAVAPEAAEAARKWIEGAFGAGALPEKRPIYASRAGAQEAHEAVRPTDPARSSQAAAVLGEREGRLYDLVRRRFLASQMAPAAMERFRWTIAAGPGGRDTLVAPGRRVLDPGFFRVLPPESLADEPPEVPEVPVGYVWHPDDEGFEAASVPSHTKPPARLSEATLVAELERAGVGRPSTYAQILRTLVDRGYVLVDRRVFVVTPVGRLLVHHLERFFPDLVDVGFTAGVEEQLDRVAAGEAEHLAFLEDFYVPFHGRVATASRAEGLEPAAPLLLEGLSCPACRHELVLRFQRRDLLVYCSGCREPGGIRWAPRRARRPAGADRASERKGVEEQAAADQRLQDRCPRCEGAMGRWKLTGDRFEKKAGRSGLHVHLCQAWPVCDGYRGESSGAGRPSRRGR